MTLKSLVTTVATPLKKVGRVCPSIWWLNPFTSINAPFCSETSRTMPDGYISFAVGANTAAGYLVSHDPAPFVDDWASVFSRILISWGRVRGYDARSSCGANCAGLTKMETTVRSFSDSDFFTVVVA